MHASKVIQKLWLISQEKSMEKSSETNTEKVDREQDNDSCIS